MGYVNGIFKRIIICKNYVFVKNVSSKVFRMDETKNPLHVSYLYKF